MTPNEILLKKFTHPMFDGPGLTEPVSDEIREEITKMYKEHMKSPPEGVIITGPNHEIKTIGA